MSVNVFSHVSGCVYSSLYKCGVCTRVSASASPYITVSPYFMFRVQLVCACILYASENLHASDRPPPSPP